MNERRFLVRLGRVEGRDFPPGEGKILAMSPHDFLLEEGF
jgi:hypothetical protein